MRPGTRRLLVYATTVFGSLAAGAAAANRLWRPDLSLPDLTAQVAREQAEKAAADANEAKERR